MNSPTSAKSSNSVRRGPTMRGGRYRPGVGRSVRVPQRRSSINNAEEGLVNQDEEERMGLTAKGSTGFDDEKYDNYDSSNNRLSEKLETDEHGKPIYHHGEETFGDILTHPIEELHAHQHRKEDFQSKVGRWSLLQETQRDLGAHNNSSNSTAHPEHHENIDYAIVLHFRQLRGNQKFVLSHDAAIDFCKRLNFTSAERIQFNGIHDTDGLTEFLYKIKRDFSIKIHHKGDFIRDSSLMNHGSEHLEAPLPVTHHHHNPDHHTIEFNENVYVEFKPKHDHHAVVLPAEATRRPFFQHPEPDLSADIGEESAASWLELFYDLFFVATLTQFTHSHHIKDWESLGLYAQWFVITWWAWCASSLYTARFDTDDVVHHIYKFIEMCALIGMAGSSEYFLNSPGYVYGYIALKGVLALEYFVVFVVAILAKSKSRVALAFYIGANLLSIALWASSLVILEKGTHRILWYLGVGCEVLVNVIVRGDKTLSWAASHLAERLGLLSLIVLGENLMGLVTLVSVAGTDLIIVIPNFMAVLIIFGFFFMYFEDFNKEIFLHNKYHQVWVYLHFPLHLCQVAFGISLIDILKIYRYQLIRDSKLVDNSATAGAGGHGGATTGASGHGGATTSTSESSSTGHGSGSASGAAEHPTSGAEHPTSSAAEHPTGASASTASGSREQAAAPTTSATTETAATSAHHNTKRAILMVSNEQTTREQYGYNPMKMAQSIQENNRRASTAKAYQEEQQFQWTLWYKSIAATMVATTMQMIASYGHSYGNSSANNYTIGGGSHHLMRRSEPEAVTSGTEGEAAAGGEGEGFTGSLTMTEISFVYKIFLIFAGLILVMNSLIKALNTKLSDIYGKIIIVSRILNAIILWSLCALPFAKLDAIVLLCTMVGSLLFQALIDLLD